MSQMNQNNQPGNNQPAPGAAKVNTKSPMEQQMELIQKQTKVLKKQLWHGRIRTLIMLFVLGVTITMCLYIRSTVKDAMKTVDAIYGMTQTATELAGQVSDLTKDISDTVDALDTEEINVLISNMSDVSASLKGSVEALDVDGLNEAVTNMNDVAENLSSVASLLNGAADTLKGIFGGK